MAFPPCVPIIFFEGVTTKDGFAIRTDFERYAASIWLEVISDLPDFPIVAPVGTEMTGMYRFTTSDVAGCPAVDNGTVSLVKTSDEN